MFDIPEKKFYACTFKDGGKSYAYHYEGSEEIKIGDLVLLDGKRQVKVVRIIGAEPPFPTKPILEKAPEETEEKGA